MPLIIAAIACGWVGWSGEVLLLPFAAIFPVFWAMAPSRKNAAFVTAGYFLAASRGLPQGVANFYRADLWPGLLLWVVASASFVTVHAVLWTKPGGENASDRKGNDAARALRYLLAMALTGLPPFGITGWAHPVTGAGVLFPGWGWLGLSAMATGLLIMTTRLWPAAAFILGGFWLWSAATWTELKLPDLWRGVDLEVGQNLGRDGSLLYHRALIATMLGRIAAHPDTRVVVLPESTLGFWTPTVARVWREGLRGSGLTVIAGAAVVDPKGYDNVMVVVSADAGKILYRERMPVPGSMWQPWLRWTGQGGGAHADFFANPVVEVDGVRIAPLICYEQLILWPVLQSMLHSPEVIVAVGNGWWTENTAIVAIQKANAIAWARLFDLPIIMAFNT
ncbi:conjugal transfer protein TraB [Agrobacterium sp. TS43]|uniref:conjugal transfer protein TraB n=1 Tax=Agrobacterium TaxID=357 RepID=UPI0004A16069|nr:MULTISPECIES: conjugal transfer protein TraB [Agrobacterium]KDR90377.1 conjugal transfer protein TraB [Agrobacterium tumefaciens GW4]KVK46657.1 conjugal transfer protein TraB [Agrobacterium sp. LY4]KVK46897.1 conjugal transfer protein TraB [Agrobacterium sp. JL28]KVK61222.1 conjugal transfer protein TraB [Agrobacterium sp. TS45]KVK66352.1 conjugal transfer protein TraB [Agrobacterium sp. C13]